MAMQTIHQVDLDESLEVGRDEASIDRLSAAMIFPSAPNDQIEYFRDMALPGYSSNYSTFSGRIVDGVNNGVVAGACLLYFRFLQNADIKTKAGNQLEASQRAVFHLCKEFNLGRDRKADLGQLVVRHWVVRKVLRYFQAPPGRRRNLCDLFPSGRPSLTVASPHGYVANLRPYMVICPILGRIRLSICCFRCLTVFGASEGKVFFL